MRSFVALELPAALRGELERRIGAARPGLPKARWVDPANLHLTLAFLGDVEASQGDALAARLGVVFQRHAAFDLKLEEGGGFPPRRPARVIWVGLPADPALLALQTDVDRVCRDELELEPARRPFHPHLTVARCRRPWPLDAVRRWREALRGALGAPFTVREGVVMESRLTPSGAVYRPLARLPLERRG